MHPQTVVLTLVFTVIMSPQASHSVILRPDWFPYFRDDGNTAWKMRGDRTVPENIPCPDDMTEYECYHTYMAVWSRLLQKDKRSAPAMLPARPLGLLLLQHRNRASRAC
ncbi:uncharacterized protein LOC143286472 [Babylonia areolata]|uniref:uncharacterized protein LOC143286472 n=1 Tax=Babylonia areolata TaxID=304850 RepID=UPI003FD5219F